MIKSAAENNSRIRLNNNNKKKNGKPSEFGVCGSAWPTKPTLSSTGMMTLQWRN